jgi:hypothetical protein
LTQSGHQHANSAQSGATMRYQVLEITYDELT